MFEVQNLITSTILALNVVTASTAASSSYGGAVSTIGAPVLDLAPYVGEGKRLAKIVCFFAPSSNSSVPSTAGTSANFLLYQCTSSNGTFTAVSTSSTGATITETSTYASVGAFAEFGIVPSQRFVTGYAVVTSSAAGQEFALGMSILEFSKAV